MKRLSSLAFLTPLSFVLLALLYVGLAVVRLRYPGLHFDELLHVNAALGGLDNTFIYKTLFGVPFLLMPYIGALKAWLTGPLFALFGVSVVSIRLPLIIVTAAALYLLGRTLQRWVGLWPAFAVCLLLAVDPTFIALTRADSGPVVLQFALTVTALSCLGTYLRTRQLLPLVGLVSSLGLGVFNKLNFIWIANGFVVAFVLVYARSLWVQLRASTGSVNKKWWHVLLFLGGYGLSAAYYLLASYKFNLFDFLSPQKFNWSARLANLSSSLSGLVRGDLFYNYAYGQLQWRGASIVFWIVAATSLVGVALLLSKRLYKRSERQLGVFALLLVTATLAQLIVTRNAVWPWHYATLYPALQIVFVLGLVGYYRLFQKTGLHFAKLASLPLLLLTSTYLLGDIAYVRALGQPTKNVYWSPAIYTLYDYTQRLEGQVVSVDWGTHTQLLGLSQDPAKYHNASFSLNRDPLPSDAKRQFNQDYLERNVTATEYFILHTPRTTLFPAARKNFFALASAAGYTPRLVHTVADGSTTLFEIYQLKKLG
ncbi:MAG: glycosyltransferase family 39 protein [Candidatus Andersenbacteria bacterium]